MAIIKYTVKENKAVGTHSYYAQAVSYSTLDIDDLAEEVAESVGVSPFVVEAVINRYALVAEREVLRGHRVRLADLLTLYPQISASVKDKLDDQGKVLTRATAEQFTLANARSTIGATLSQTVQQNFSRHVQWKRVGEDDATAKDQNPVAPTDNPSGDDGGGTSADNPDTRSGGGTSGGTTEPSSGNEGTGGAGDNT